MRGAGDGSARRSVVPRCERWRGRGHRGARQVDSEPAASANLRAGASASAPVRCRRARRHVHEFLGQYRGTLLSDGYEAYAACAAQRSGEVTHALCWAHTRRYFERAKDSEPEAVTEALAAHRSDVRSREANPCRRVRWRGQARLPPDPYPGGRRDLLAVVPHAMSSPRTATEEPAGEGVAATRRSAARGWRCSSTTPRWPSTRTTWNGRCVRFLSGRGIGCSLRARSVRSAWASSRVCW